MATVKAMIQTAKTAWRFTARDPGKGDPYPLDNWRLYNDTVLLADGTPPRAKGPYIHAFLFFPHLDHRGQTVHLVGIGKASAKKTLSWRGSQFVKGKVVAYYRLDQYRVLDGTWPPAEKDGTP